ncbi:unnamed protein product [Cyprideis torosa]|uniref:Uncharacterized protein n=1 Tax=Cyprideis torosa TaxID=163714 RepID=A0A7R8W4R8_9CRUS|nr:unnamed protein product [Cyprideis torosa]CAG0879844.1 unnamed protein product [Cyprideis torosa]
MVEAIRRHPDVPIKSKSSRLTRHATFFAGSGKAAAHPPCGSIFLGQISLGKYSSTSTSTWPSKYSSPEQYSYSFFNEYEYTRGNTAFSIPLGLYHQLELPKWLFGISLSKAANKIVSFLYFGRANHKREVPQNLALHRLPPHSENPSSGVALNP